MYAHMCISHHTEDGVRGHACVNPPSFEDADGEDEGEDEFVLLKQ